MENLVVLWKLIEQLIPVIPGQEQIVHIWNKVSGDVIVGTPSEIMRDFYYRNMYTAELGVYVDKNVIDTTKTHVNILVSTLI